MYKHTPQLFLLILSITCLKVMTLEYHLSSYASLNLNNVSSITAIGNDGIGIVSGSSKLTILSQLDYRNKLSEYNYSVDISQIKINQLGVIINQGKSVSIIDINSKINRIAFDQTRLWSNMVFLQPDLALFAVFALVPTILKLNLTSMTLQTHTYQFSFQNLYDPIQIHKLHNGDILIGFDTVLAILQSRALAVKQTIDQKCSINAITSYFDQNQKIWIALVGSKLYQGYRWYQLIYNASSSRYQQHRGFVSSASANLYLTNRSSGVTVNKLRAYHYSSFDNIVDIDLSNNERVQLGKTILAISYSQTIFLVRCQMQDQNYYYVYRIGQNYKITKYQEIIIENRMTIINKAIFTNNDMYIFMKFRSQTRSGIMLLDIQSDFLQVIASGNYSQLDFYVLDVNKYRPLSNVGRFVVLSIDNTDSKLYLQLRESIKTVIHTLQLNISNPNSSLIANILWDQYFIVNQFTQKNDSILYLFKIEANDQLVSAQKTLTINSRRVYGCGNYLVVWVDQANKLQFYNFRDLSLAKQLALQQQVEQIIVEKNILVIYQTSISKVIVFDLSAQIQQKGAFLVQSPGNYLFPPLFLILPQQQLIYQLSVDLGFKQKDVDMLYNFSRPTIETINKYAEYGEVYISPSYYINQTNPKCSLIFYIQISMDNVSLIRYSECGLPKTAYLLTKPTKQPMLQLAISNNKQFIIILYLTYRKNASNALVQVRKVEDPAQIIFTHNIQANAGSFAGNFFSADIVNQMLVAHFYDFIYVTSLYPMAFSDGYQISTITAFGVNCNKIMVISGPSSIVDNQFRIKAMAFNGGQVLFDVKIDSSATLLQISDGSNFIATYLSNSVLTVWKVSSQYVVLNKTITDLNRFRFFNQQQLLLQYSNHFEILNIPTFSPILKQTSQTQTTTTANTNYFVEFSPDGFISAQILADNTINISNPGQTFTFQSPIKNQTFVGLTILQNKTLLAITNTGILFVLSPTPCQSNYINNNGLCQCNQPFIEVNGQCLSSPDSFPLWAILLITILGVVLIVVLLLRLRSIYGKRPTKMMEEEQQDRISDYSQLRSQITEDRRLKV